MKKIRLGLVFGGRSVEHDVSILSARAVLAHLDRDKYEIVPIGITREGRWLTAGDAQVLLDEDLASRSARPVLLPPDPGVGGLLPSGPGESAIARDVIFPLVHGPGGEDGTIQGLLELAGLPYVGSGVLGSSLGMDKIAMKDVFRAAGLPSCRFLPTNRREIEQAPDGVCSRVESRIGFPCFTKPANGGSSVGVTKVEGPRSLRDGLVEAARYDRRVLIEEAVSGQEVECAVLGNDDPRASVVGEIVPCHDFYDYSAKYLEEGSELIIPARIETSQAERVRKLSVAAFKAIDAAGMARVDFFVRRSDGAVLINEINTIPGFTPISMYPRLWKSDGIGFPELVDRLVSLGLERHRQKAATRKRIAPEEKVPGVR
ncbi:MAG: D-alanine--D-alanine ligase family protein [Acidobacteriota bacterium]